MDIAIITGAAGLVGSESVAYLANKFDQVIGIDNDLRASLFGPEASVIWNRDRLLNKFSNYKHLDLDIRNEEAIDKVFSDFRDDVKLIVHAAAQPSHDWAAKDPRLDFTVNAIGTLNLLECLRNFCPEAVFIFMSTNKVYGDRPNELPLRELKTRWEIDESHPYFEKGVDEQMSIDQSMHSLFGSSKLSADIMVQEYGRYFGLKTGVFRGGCLSGSGHTGTQLHGFLSYLVRCTMTGDPYTIYGYKGKQVRDNIHSKDLVHMFWEYYQQPGNGEVYNVGGGRHSNCSMQEAIKIVEEIVGKQLNYQYSDTPRVGDHIWWISDVSKFQSHYPEWHYRYDLKHIISEIFMGMEERLNAKWS